MLAQGLNQTEAARRLGIAKGTLANWVVATNRPRKVVLSRNWRPKKVLSQTSIERDTMKKTAAYFTQESLPSMHG